MKILTYDDQKITVIRKTSTPSEMIRSAVQITTNKPVMNIDKTIKFLLVANHTSLFEHVSMTLLIENVSRSFLAQITRHRMSSFTTSSQHYQDYRNFPVVIDPQLVKGYTRDLIEQTINEYSNMIDYGIDKSEARQILPNVMAVNILWTINARSLINFLNLRLCKRNVLEMQIFANNLLKICHDWFPKLFKFVGPDCFMTECKQGAMSCQKE
jgi:thymidylate synthase (FAD)